MEVLCSWGEEVVQAIEFVSIELGQPYRSLVEKLMPNAVVVADRFHVMKQINEELDKQRKTEKRACQKEKSQKKRRQYYQD